MDKRIEWLDVLKGIGIFFVVAGHFYKSDDPVLVYIYSFHMPLFFFISGYVYDDRRYAGVSGFLKRGF